MEELQLGQYAFPLILTVVLGIIYKVIPAIPDRIKAPLSVGVSMGLSLLVIEYKQLVWTFPIVVDHLLYGLIAGAAASGLYEFKKAVSTNPRQ